MAPRSISVSAPGQGPTEADIYLICARAGVSCVGIQRGFGTANDFVLFQPVFSTLVVPVAVFADPNEAIAAIKAKLAQTDPADSAK